jgi:hypothetical protein
MPQWRISGLSRGSANPMLTKGVKDDGTQMRPKTYSHLILLWRSSRGSRSPRHGDLRAETSPSLIYVAVVLVCLLAILEVDRHQHELEYLGVLSNDYAAPAAFLSP